MPEAESGKFEGWYEPGEKAGLRPEQVDRLNGLERVVVDHRHADTTVGDAELLYPPSSTPREMISVPALRRFLKETAAENHVSPWDVAHQLRTLGIEDAKQLTEEERRYYERITYVSDVHEGSEDLYRRLEQVVQNAPDRVIFIGDVIGTDQFGALQKYFYNYLNNHARSELKLHERDDVSDSEILQYSGNKPPEDDFTLRKGFLELRGYELELEGIPEDERAAMLAGFTDEQIAQEIRKYAQYKHYGHYASNLPEAAKRTLAAGLEENAQKLLAVIKRMQAGGSSVDIIEGNWDARAPIDYVPGLPEAKPLPKEERLFNPKDFFEKNGVAFHDSVTALETKTTLQVLLPFDSLIDFPQLPDEKKQEIQERVVNARTAHKSVIIAAHGEPDLQMHRLPTANLQVTGEHADVMKGLGQALALIKPDELVYGHMHDVFTDEDKQPMDPNIKYALQIDDEGNVAIQTNLDQSSKDSVVVSYMPWKREAELRVPKLDRERKVAGFGGNREPVKVM